MFKLKSSIFVIILGLLLCTDIHSTENLNKEYKRDFPNHFKLLGFNDLEDTNLTKEQFLSTTFMSILDRLELPYIDERENVNFKQFFPKIQSYVQKICPDSKLYISGGVVRSILGYIYKIMHNTYKNYDKNDKKSLECKIQEKILNVITGVNGKGKLKNLSPLEVLGIGSDLDLLIDFPKEYKGNKSQIKNNIRDYINSVESKFNLRYCPSSMKSVVLPIADVKDYDEQYGSSGDRSAVDQGGSAIDWIAFDLGTKFNVNGFRLPQQHSNLIDLFFNGELMYLEPTKNFLGEVPPKQPIRALRPLTEIPFLSYTESSMNIWLKDIELFNNQSSIDEDQKAQFIKMLRNGRFQSGNSRFINIASDDPNKLICETIFSASKKNSKNALGKLPLIPEILPNKNILRRETKENLDINDILISPDGFNTENKPLYHGTPDILNLICMIRNGLLPSNANQGNAVFGSGFYTTYDQETAKEYAGKEGNGIVIPLTINGEIKDKLRIIDVNTMETGEFIKKIKSEKGENCDINKILAEEYDIDIIVNSHVLIQNQNVIKVPSNLKGLIALQIEQMTSQYEKLEIQNDGVQLLNLARDIDSFSQLFVSMGGEGQKNSLQDDFLNDLIKDKVGKECPKVLEISKKFRLKYPNIIELTNKIKEMKDSENSIRMFLEADEILDALSSNPRYFVFNNIVDAIQMLDQSKKPEDVKNFLLSLKEKGIKMDLSSVPLATVIKSLDQLQHPNKDLEDSIRIFLEVNEILDVLSSKPREFSFKDIIKSIHILDQSKKPENVKNFLLFLKEKEIKMNLSSCSLASVIKSLDQLQHPDAILKILLCIHQKKIDVSRFFDPYSTSSSKIHINSIEDLDKTAQNFEGSTKLFLEVDEILDVISNNSKKLEPKDIVTSIQILDQSKKPEDVKNFLLSLKEKGIKMNLSSVPLAKVIKSLDQLQNPDAVLKILLSIHQKKIDVSNFFNNPTSLFNPKINLYDIENLDKNAKDFKGSTRLFLEIDEILDVLSSKPREFNFKDIIKSIQILDQLKKPENVKNFLLFLKEKEIKIDLYSGSLDSLIKTIDQLENPIEFSKALLLLHKEGENVASFFNPCSSKIKEISQIKNLEKVCITYESLKEIFEGKTPGYRIIDYLNKLSMAENDMIEIIKILYPFFKSHLMEDLKNPWNLIDFYATKLKTVKQTQEVVDSAILLYNDLSKREVRVTLAECLICLVKLKSPGLSTQKALLQQPGSRHDLKKLLEIYDEKL